MRPGLGLIINSNLNSIGLSRVTEFEHDLTLYVSLILDFSTELVSDVKLNLTWSLDFNNLVKFWGVLTSRQAWNCIYLSSTLYTLQWILYLIFKLKQSTPTRVLEIDTQCISESAIIKQLRSRSDLISILISVVNFKFLHSTSLYDFE